MYKPSYLGYQAIIRMDAVMISLRLIKRGESAEQIKLNMDGSILISKGVTDGKLTIHSSTTTDLKSDIEMFSK